MIEHIFDWSILGGFIEKFGISITIWFFTVFILYRIFMVFGVKLWDRFGPIVDAHFELIISMKDNMAKQTHVMEEVKATIERHSAEALDGFKKNHEALYEIREGQKEAAKCLLTDHGIERKNCGHTPQ